jgi:prepilin-type N-terminal cleavage/methylation domain-containing protein
MGLVGGLNSGWNRSSSSFATVADGWPFSVQDVQMAQRCRQTGFTLLEVVIAITILAMSVAFTMSLIAGARSQVLRSEKRWGRAHVLAQAAEYYLLAGPKASDEPEALLPEGFSMSCELLEVTDIPEEAQEPIQGWLLGEFVIRVRDPSGGLIGEVRVRQPVREEDLE